MRLFYFASARHKIPYGLGVPKKEVFMERVSDRFAVKLIKGLLVGVSISLALILVFAFALKFVDLSAGWIKGINQVIKLVSVGVACLVSVNEGKGWLKGMATGFGVIVVTYLLFGFVSGSLSFGASCLWEALYGLIAGALAGIISVNLKK